jgi:hypothetical protein
VLEEPANGALPIVLTEFGGLTESKVKGDWGYTQAQSGEDFADLYRELLAVVNSLALFSGFCYTQFADTYQEANGLLWADRTPKFPLEEIATATRGEAAPRPPGGVAAGIGGAGTRHDPHAPDD